MKKRFFLVTLFVLSFTAFHTYAQKVVSLYESKAPGSEDWNYKKVEYTNPGPHGLMIRNVVDPTLTIFQPKKSEATGTSVIICPGGANIWLSYESEGTRVAEWLAKKGITAFVLEYRLNKTIESEEEFDKVLKAFSQPKTSSNDSDITRPTLESFIAVKYDNYFGGDDGIQALKYVRQHAEEYNIDPDKIGMIGFSAGAGVTMHVVLNSDSVNPPDFAASIYGGRLANITIPENVPPLFILCAADDPIAEGSPDLYKKWRAAGHFAELHIYSKGGHGFGMDKQNMPIDKWIERLYDWIRTNGF